MTAADWAEAALAALRDEGSLSAIAIEPLAARLGATKGSFYWHFTNRDALIDAALADWEARSTHQLTAALAVHEGEPAARARELLRTMTGLAERDATELALLAEAGQPRVAAVLERVITRRLDALAGWLRATLGLSAEEAGERALRLYCEQLGRAQILRAIPGLLPEAGWDEERRLDAALESLLGPAAVRAPVGGGRQPARS
ncbi:TetR/AcrR family transcriptional regulator [Streptomyces sp. DSM 44915]|uniref:TetR/AcrR family transcriptional regulator n=1 Tax=Streptomyces chisholmiae TaxID=3075540 RepID=A0ABU2JIS4_9ACTN|nr:TetR/AcrR family transcriptional regulator [Streptomyces sp. DSM 44915]MDT0264884.1 TetR/AcrR family transcriptional regulator [Streptomyces sp. DSM 44915]